MRKTTKRQLYKQLDELVGAISTLSVEIAESIKTSKDEEEFRHVIDALDHAQGHVEEARLAFDDDEG